MWEAIERLAARPTRSSSPPPAAGAAVAAGAGAAGAAWARKARSLRHVRTTQLAASRIAAARTAQVAASGEEPATASMKIGPPCQ